MLHETRFLRQFSHGLYFIQRTRRPNAELLFRQIEIYSPEDVPVYDATLLKLEKMDEITAIYKVVETL